MVDILHRVGITAPKDDVFRALTTRDGLAAWWTEDTSGDGTPGGVLEFRFDQGGCDMKVLEAAPAARVLCAGAARRADQRLALRPCVRMTLPRVRREGWRQPSMPTPRDGPALVAVQV